MFKFEASLISKDKHKHIVEELVKYKCTLLTGDEQKDFLSKENVITKQEQGKLFKLTTNVFS